MSCRPEPVHGYTIEFWERDTCSDYKPRKHVAVYHVHTSWSDHPWSARMSGRGADFVDQWAVEDEEGAGGRWDKWNGKLIALIKSSDFHSSRFEALQATLEGVQRSILSKQREVDSLKVCEMDLLEQVRGILIEAEYQKRESRMGH